MKIKIWIIQMILKSFFRMINKKLMTLKCIQNKVYNNIHKVYNNLTINLAKYNKIKSK